ncbi:MAG: hypothetical protein ABI674_06610 [Spartobacteria bacterium]
MANPLLDEKTSEPLPVAAAAPARRSLWARIRNSRFLFISVVVHLLFGLVAAIYVVQVYSPARKLTFKGGPPSPNRSERSIEHKVQMAKKQSTMSAPAVTRRIVTTGIAKVTLPEMPAMPQTNNAAPMKMAGVGGAGIGAPTALTGGDGSQGGGGPISFFGLRETGSGSFAGTLYDLKQTQTHRSTDMSEQKYGEIVTGFIKGGWNESAFQNFYRAPQTLYNVQIFTPYMSADEGPRAFHVSGEVKPKLWLALYRGRVSPPESGTYHFVGAGDDLLVVRFNGQVVLDGSWNPHGVSSTAVNYDYGFSKIPNKFVKGPAVSVKAGNFYDMEILIGEQPGGEFFADLLIEKDGATYEKESHGSPILPIFRVAEGKMPALKSGQKLPPFLEKGPVWRAEVVKPEKK